MPATNCFHEYMPRKFTEHESQDFHDLDVAEVCVRCGIRTLRRTYTYPAGIGFSRVSARFFLPKPLPENGGLLGIEP